MSKGHDPHKSLVSITSGVIGLVTLLLSGLVSATGNTVFILNCGFDVDGKELPVASVHHEVENPVGSKTKFLGMRLVREVDELSPLLLELFTTGKHCPVIQIKVYSDSDSSQLLWQMDLDKVIFEHRKEWFTDGQVTPHEALHLTVNEFTWTHFDESGGITNQHCWAFDRAQEC